MRKFFAKSSGEMEDPANDFDSIQWRREDEHPESPKSPPQSPPARLKSNGKKRQSINHSQTPSDPNVDAVDVAGIGEGYLECKVGKPQKEGEGTKDAFVSYLITTHVWRLLLALEISSD